jgi:cytochrome c-type biogenesis protein CcmH
MRCSACWPGSDARRRRRPIRRWSKRLDRRWPQQLRCLVCQNQTHRRLSRCTWRIDLKDRSARSSWRRAAPSSEVIDFMVQRYGDFVLYRPPLKGSHRCSCGPARSRCLAAGLAALLVNLRRRGLGADDPVTEENA